MFHHPLLPRHSSGSSSSSSTGRRVPSPRLQEEGSQDEAEWEARLFYNAWNQRMQQGRGGGGGRRMRRHNVAHHALSSAAEEEEEEEKKDGFAVGYNYRVYVREKLKNLRPPDTAGFQRRCQATILYFKHNLFLFLACRQNREEQSVLGEDRISAN